MKPLVAILSLAFASLIVIVTLLSLSQCDKPSPLPPRVKPAPTPVPVARPTSIPQPTPQLTGWIKVQTDRWETAQIRPEKAHAAAALSQAISRNKTRYAGVQSITAVPWQVIGSIHNMECGLSFRTNLANGDPLTARSIHDPRGRPTVGSPPFSWETAAVDALQYDHMDKASWASIGQTLQNVEAYNGLGYQKQHQNVPSPYLWSWTNLYTSGKYIADGKWSPTAVSAQAGVVSLLKNLE